MGKVAAGTRLLVAPLLLRDRGGLSWSQMGLALDTNYRYVIRVREDTGAWRERKGLGEVVPKNSARGDGSDRPNPAGHKVRSHQFPRWC
jgi:hypothetical protein